jgi:hypothetical protein
MSGNFVEFFSYGGDDAEPESAERILPTWFGPSEDELGVCVPQALILGRSERAVVALGHITAYSTGLSFEFLARAKGLREREAQRLMHEQHVLDDELSDGVLRLGLEFADGSRASNLVDRRRLWGSPKQPEQPVLIQQGGGGGSSGAGNFMLRPGYWLWPLPPAGEMVVYVEWPALGIALERTALDVGPILKAAGESLRLWT